MQTNRHFDERCKVMLTELVPQWLQVLHIKLNRGLNKNQILSTN